MGDRVLAYDTTTGKSSYDQVQAVIVHTDSAVEQLTIDDETLTTAAAS